MKKLFIPILFLASGLWLHGADTPTVRDQLNDAEKVLYDAAADASEAFVAKLAERANTGPDQSEIDALKAQMAQLQQINSVLAAQNTSLRSQVSQAQADRDAAQKAYDDLIKALAALLP